MDKIKVLHVIKTLDLGGAEVNLLNLSAAFDPSRFEMHVAYSAGGSLEPQFLSHNVRLFKFAKKRHKLKSLASFIIVARLVKYILRYNISIVHTHTFNAHIWAGLAAKLTGRKIVEHVHDFRYIEPDDRSRRKGVGNQFKYVYFLKNFSDRVIVLTRQNFEFLIRNKLYPAEKIRIYLNGIPVLQRRGSEELKKSLMEQFGISGERRLILTAARLSPEKNLELIFRIAPSVLKKVPNALFLIAGDGPLFGQLKALSASQDINGRIKLIGFTADISGLLEITDLFILPSFLELHSLAVLEAMNKKVPVILSKDVGSNNDFLKNGENGYLLDPFDDRGWAEAASELLLNEDLRQKIAENAYQTCLQKFNIKDTAIKLEKLYLELVGA